jgi:hypothetical protein
VVERLSVLTMCVGTPISNGTVGRTRDIMSGG